MIKNKKSLKGSKTPSRRKFFKAAAATGAAAADSCSNAKCCFWCSANIKDASSMAKSGANIFFEMAGDYCKMVSDMSGGSLKIDLTACWSSCKDWRNWSSSK